MDQFFCTYRKNCIQHSNRCKLDLKIVHTSSSYLLSSVFYLLTHAAWSCLRCLTACITESFVPFIYSSFLTSFWHNIVSCNIRVCVTCLCHKFRYNLYVCTKIYGLSLETGIGAGNKTPPPPPESVLISMLCYEADISSDF